MSFPEKNINCDLKVQELKKKWVQKKINWPGFVIKNYEGKPLKFVNGSYSAVNNIIDDTRTENLIYFTDLNI